MVTKILPIYLHLRFHKDERSKLCTKDFETINYHQIYYKNDDNLYSYYGKKYHSITYYMFYKENYAIGLNGIFPNSKCLGYHEKDIEHVRILFDLETFDPVFVYFSSHAQEGVWKRYQDCEIYNDRLVVYISKGSHACRPKGKTYYRIFGFANDYASGRGIHITPFLMNSQSLYDLNVANKEVFSDGIKPFILPLINYKVEQLKEKQKAKEDAINNIN
jgi:hypothetical protein